MSFGMFEAAVAGDKENEHQKKLAKTRLAQAAAEVDQKLGSFLSKATSKSDYIERVRLAENDFREIVGKYLEGDTGFKAVATKMVDHYVKKVAFTDIKDIRDHVDGLGVKTRKKGDGFTFPAASGAKGYITVRPNGEIVVETIIGGAGGFQSVYAPNEMDLVERWIEKTVGGSYRMSSRRHANGETHFVHDNGVVEVFDADAYLRENPNADIVTDGYDGRMWDDSVSTSWTPAPGGRSPFEYDRDYEDDWDEVHEASRRRRSNRRTARGVDFSRSTYDLFEDGSGDSWYDLVDTEENSYDSDDLDEVVHWLKQDGLLPYDGRMDTYTSDTYEDPYGSQRYEDSAALRGFTNEELHEIKRRMSNRRTARGVDFSRSTYDLFEDGSGDSWYDLVDEDSRSYDSDDLDEVVTWLKQDGLLPYDGRHDLYVADSYEDPYTSQRYEDSAALRGFTDEELHEIKRRMSSRRASRGRHPFDRVAGGYDWGDKDYHGEPWPDYFDDADKESEWLDFAGEHPDNLFDVGDVLEDEDFLRAPFGTSVTVPTDDFDGEGNPGEFDLVKDKGGNWRNQDFKADLHWSEIGQAPISGLPENRRRSF